MSTSFDVTKPPSERVSLVKCDDCKEELAKLAWKNFEHDNLDGWMVMLNAEIAIEDAHEVVCPKI